MSTLEQFLEKNKIDHIYELVSFQDGGTTYFGWREAKELDSNEKLILSYPSKAKGVTEEEKNWSKIAGRNIVTKTSYSNYIKSYLGETPEKLWQEWGGKRDAFLSYWDSNHPKGLGPMIYDLLCLINEGKKFVNLGRGFRVMPSLKEFEDSLHADE